MEIYLPKKTVYQPFLFEVLTNGFKIEHVRSHFLSNEKRPGITTFLAGNPNNPMWPAYDDATIAKLRPILFGYSMYEVDGVFKGSRASEPIYEERTQVIRLMFRLDLDELIEVSKAHYIPKREVRAQVSHYLRAYNRYTVREASAATKYQRVVDAAHSWRADLGFFVFGYIIYELCMNIQKLHQHGIIPSPEEEIWVMHFANLELDRVLWTKPKLNSLSECK